MEQLQAKHIGQVLKDRRNQLGYTQEFAARGEQLPSLEVCLQLAQVFHLSLDRWLLDTSKTDNEPELADMLDCLSKLSRNSVDDIQNLLQKISLYIK